jgi:hypothetical protein
MPQIDDSLRSAMIDVIEGNVGGSATLQILQGQRPATPTVVAHPQVVVIDLPTDWLTAASAGMKEMLGAWSGVVGNPNTGNPLYYQIRRSGGAVAMQGAVTQEGGIDLGACATSAGNATITAPANSVPNGARVSGTGITAGTYVVSGGGTTAIVLSKPPTLTQGSVSLNFVGELTLQNINLVTGQVVNITGFEISLGGES